MYFDVLDSDKVAVTSLGLTVGGTPVVLGSNGQGQFTANAWALGKWDILI